MSLGSDRRLLGSSLSVVVFCHLWVGVTHFLLTPCSSSVPCHQVKYMQISIKRGEQFLLECKMIWHWWQMVASSLALSSPTSLPLNANHLASCKTQKYPAFGVWMYILVYPYLNTTFIFLYTSKMHVAHQIAHSAWLVIVFHLMDSLQADHAWCWLSMISWLQVTLECACNYAWFHGSRWLHDQQAAKYIHCKNATLSDSIKQRIGEGTA
jgi:hypothetical protein